MSDSWCRVSQVVGQGLGGVFRITQATEIMHVGGVSFCVVCLRRGGLLVEAVKVGWSSRAREGGLLDLPV